jgi:hypothetical protein
VCVEALIVQLEQSVILIDHLRDAELLAVTSVSAPDVTDGPVLVDPINPSTAVSRSLAILIHLIAIITTIVRVESKTVNGQSYRIKPI